MSIRAGQIDDIPGLRAVFNDSIRQTCQRDYTSEQIEAWLHKGLSNPQRWEKLMAEQQVFVLESDAKIILGFASLHPDGLIDMFYLHPVCQGQGYAKRLYHKIESEARKQNQKSLYAHVSLTARAFFQRMGFKVEKTQIVHISGEELHNFRMHKAL